MITAALALIVERPGLKVTRKLSGVSEVLEVASLNTIETTDEGKDALRSSMTIALENHQYTPPWMD